VTSRAYLFFTLQCYTKKVFVYPSMNTNEKRPTCEYLYGYHDSSRGSQSPTSDLCHRSVSDPYPNLKGPCLFDKGLKSSFPMVSESCSLLPIKKIRTPLWCSCLLQVGNLLVCWRHGSRHVGPTLKHLVVLCRACQKAHTFKQNCLQINRFALVEFCKRKSAMSDGLVCSSNMRYSARSDLSFA